MILSLLQKITVLTVMLFIFNIVQGQTGDEEESDSVNISGYLSPFVHSAGMVKQSIFSGGSGAIFITKNISVGGYGITMVNYFEIDTGAYKGNELDVGGGGLSVNCFFMNSKKLHPVISLWLGGGSISVSDKQRSRIKDAYDDFFFTNLTAEIEYRPWNFLSASVGYHYQRICGLKLDGYTGDDFNGGGFYACLRIGIFR